MGRGEHGLLCVLVGHGLGEHESRGTWPTLCIGWPQVRGAWVEGNMAYSVYWLATGYGSMGRAGHVSWVSRMSVVWHVRGFDSTTASASLQPCGVSGELPTPYEGGVWCLS